MPAFQSAGIKLKLIHVLNTSGHIITNSIFISDKKIEKFCNIAETIQDMRALVVKKSNKLLDEEEVIKRNIFLKKNYSNRKNAQLLKNNIFNN